jgi:DnaJ-class molecular chaperone|tara:strand:+ start:138 stop:308 length:171 start_codon:yes stop_codon:yes gene_type:complete
MSYKEICSLCKGNGYIKIQVQGKNEIKQCWICESSGEVEHSQADVDDFIYKMYYKK